jgi:hypothetical protein
MRSKLEAWTVCRLKAVDTPPCEGLGHVAATSDERGSGLGGGGE